MGETDVRYQERWEAAMLADHCCPIKRADGWSISLEFDIFENHVELSLDNHTNHSIVVFLEFLLRVHNNRPFDDSLYFIFN